MGRRGRRRGPYRVGDEHDEELEPRVITARNRALDAQLERLSRDGRIRAAALIADTFKLDPVAVLEERDELKRNVRLAAHNLIQTEAEKAYKSRK